jgi:hypothetical protein
MRTYPPTLGVFLCSLVSLADTAPPPDAESLLAALDNHTWTGTGSYVVPDGPSGTDVAAQADAWWFARADGSHEHWLRVTLFTTIDVASGATSDAFSGYLIPRGPKVFQACAQQDHVEEIQAGSAQGAQLVLDHLVGADCTPLGTAVKLTLGTTATTMTFSVASAFGHAGATATGSVAITP